MFTDDDDDDGDDDDVFTYVLLHLITFIMLVQMMM